MRGRWHGTYTAWTCNSQLATAESPTATQRPKRALRRPYSSTPLFVASRLRPRCLEPTDDRNGVLRLWPDGVVRVDICRPDPSVLVDDVASRHRQPKVGLVVKLVERVAERRVELLQIRWKREREPEGLGHAEVEVGQDIASRAGARPARTAPPAERAQRARRPALEAVARPLAELRQLREPDPRRARAIGLQRPLRVGLLPSSLRLQPARRLPRRQTPAGQRPQCGRVGRGTPPIIDG